MNLRQYLYLSRLAPHCTMADVTDIVRGARARNAIQGITGLLLFNGDTFCQYVEGPVGPAGALVQALHRDVRHEQLLVVHDAEASLFRRMPLWSLGYAYDEAAFEPVRRARGLEAVVAFEGLVAGVDVGAEIG